jgi:holo-[acyl-carrier protein] synthase
VIGIDLLEVERMERALARRPGLADRLFTAPAQHLAARFCAKEAVAKALALRAWNPHDVEVVPTDTAPRVRLRGHAAKRAAALGVEVEVSLTHSRGMAGAVAIAR